MIKVAFIVCHSKKSKGGYSTELTPSLYHKATGEIINKARKLDENTFYRIWTPKLMRKVVELSKGKVQACCVYRDHGYAHALKNIKHFFGLNSGEEIDWCIEPHSNGSSNKTVHGGEILVETEDRVTINLCANFMQRWHKETAIALRHTNGVKKLDDNDRGDYLLERMDTVSKQQIVPELFYHSNYVDAVFVYSDPERYINLVAKLICEELLQLDISNPVEQPQKKESLWKRIKNLFYKWFR